MAVISKQEAAKYLDVPVTTLDHWRWSGRGPEFVKFPKEIKYSHKALDAFIESLTQKPSVQAFMEEQRGTV